MMIIQMFFKDIYFLFLEMAPYLVLGMSIAGILSVTIDASLISTHIGRASIGSILKASLFGVPLPLCSCSVIPTTVYLEDSGASRPAVTAFLISTPQTGVDSITATYGMMGPLMAIYRPLSAFLLGVIGGLFNLVFGKKDESIPDDDVPESCGCSHAERSSHRHEDTGCGCSADGDTCCSADHHGHKSLIERLKGAFHYSFVSFIDDIWLHFLIGLGIAGLMGIVIPDGFFESSSFGSGITGMLTMVIIGIPLYICSTSSIPIAVMLIAKGASLGTAFVFLLAGPATNITTFIVLSKRLGKRYALQYVLILVFGSLLFGLALDGLLALYPGLFRMVPVMEMQHEGGHPGIIPLLASVLLAVLILRSMIRRLMGMRHHHNH